MGRSSSGFHRARRLPFRHAGLHEGLADLQISALPLLVKYVEAGCSDARRSAAFTFTAAARRFRRADVRLIRKKRLKLVSIRSRFARRRLDVRRPHHDRDGAVLTNTGRNGAMAISTFLRRARRSSAPFYAALAEKFVPEFSDLGVIAFDAGGALLGCLLYDAAASVAESGRR